MRPRELPSKITSILPRLFQKIEDKQILPNSFYEACIILIPKPDEDIAKRGNHKP